MHKIQQLRQILVILLLSITIPSFADNIFIQLSNNSTVVKNAAIQDAIQQVLREQGHQISTNLDANTNMILQINIQAATTTDTIAATMQVSKKITVTDTPEPQDQHITAGGNNNITSNLHSHWRRYSFVINKNVCHKTCLAKQLATAIGELLI